MFGISYRVQGPLSRPEADVNPLSAIAPGILRKIVGAMDGGGARGGAPGEVIASPSGLGRR